MIIRSIVSSISTRQMVSIYKKNLIITVPEQFFKSGDKSTLMSRKGLFCGVVKEVITTLNLNK